MSLAKSRFSGRAVAVVVAALLVVPAVWLALAVNRAQRVPAAVYLAPEYSAYKLPRSDMVDAPQR